MPPHSPCPAPSTPVAKRRAGRPPRRAALCLLAVMATPAFGAPAGAVFTPVHARNGMVATQEATATRIGVDVLRSGGNDFTGSAFFTYTDDKLTGDRIRGADVSLDFDAKTYQKHPDPQGRDQSLDSVDYETRPGQRK